MLQQWITSLNALKLNTSLIPEIILTIHTHVYVIVRFGLLTFYLEFLHLYSSVILISTIIPLQYVYFTGLTKKHEKNEKNVGILLLFLVLEMFFSKLKIHYN